MLGHPDIKRKAEIVSERPVILKIAMPQSIEFLHINLNNELLLILIQIFD